MTKKVEKRLGSYLGSPEAFASQFFSNLVLEYELKEYFAKAMAEGRLYKYTSSTWSVNLAGYAFVLYTSFGAIVTGDNTAAGGLWLSAYFHRTNPSTFTDAGGPFNCRFDTIYIPDADAVSLATFLAYIRTSGLSDYQRSINRITGQGLVYNMPTLLIPYSSSNYGRLFTNADSLVYEHCRPFVLEAYNRESSKGELGKYAEKALSRSQEMWPEMAGLWTRFVDNIGVYLPNMLDVDLNLTFDLGSKFVGCWMTRFPSSQGEALYHKMTFMQSLGNDLLSMASGGSAGASGAGSRVGAPFSYDYGMGNYGSNPAGTTGRAGYQGAAAAGAISLGQSIANIGLKGVNEVAKALRLVMPRIRAFGRQYTADWSGKVDEVPSHTQGYSAMVRLCGNVKSVTAGGFTFDVGKYLDKILILMPKDQWDWWVGEMNKIISVSTAGSGGLQAFPY